MGRKQKKESLYTQGLRNFIDCRRKENHERLGNISQSVIPISGMDRIMKGYHTDDKMIMDRILKRIGIDPAEVEMIVFKQDAERFAKRMEIYNAYNRKQYNKLERLLQEYESETKDLHDIHRQFSKKMRACMMIQQKKNDNEMIQILREAIHYTVPNFGKMPLKKMALAPEEMELLILLASCYRRRRELSRASILLKEIIDYAKGRRLPGRLRYSYVPFACLELSKTCEAQLQYEDARYYAWTGIKMLYGAGNLFYLVPLQDQYLKVEHCIAKIQKCTDWRKKRIEDVEDARRALVELYQESNMDPYYLYPIDVYQNCYFFHELLSFYRNSWKISRNDFYRGVCTLPAFLNIEKGISDPTRTFPEWMNKIGWPETYYMTPFYGENMEQSELYFRIEHEIRKQRYEKAEVLFNQLEKIAEEKNLKDPYPENKQYFSWRYAILRKTVDLLFPEEEEPLLKEALQCTIPDYDKLDISNYPLRKMEIQILTQLAANYQQQKNYQKADKLWAMLEKNYLNPWFCQGAQYEEWDFIAVNSMEAKGWEEDCRASRKKTRNIIKYFLEEGNMKWLPNCCLHRAEIESKELEKQRGRARKSRTYEKSIRQKLILERVLIDTNYDEIPIELF